MAHRSPPRTTLQQLRQGLRRRLADGARALAFWASVCLPLGYGLIAMLPSADPALLAPLVAAHAGSLVVGHTYAPDRQGDHAKGGA